MSANDRGAPTVVVATRNRGKLREILVLLEESKLGFRLVTIDELAPDVELREDEATFEGNALAKARQAASATGLPALADDSGLEVDALGGAPGVHSARYAGPQARYADNVAKLLRELAGVPSEKRTARFRTVCVAAWPDGTEISADGALAGTITEEPRGTNGFGYDPVFVPKGETRTYAELSEEEKNAISHRARAAKALRVLIPKASV